MHATAPLHIRILLVILTTLCLAGCASDIPQNDAQPETSNINIEIQAPSELGDVIAPGRHFKVSGALEGDIPNDAILTVSLFDEAGNRVRYASASYKGTELVSPESYEGAITWFDENTAFEDIAYTAPELVVSDALDAIKSKHDATTKCVYTDEAFYALITCATNPEHGLVGNDFYGLTDEEDDPYTALPEGAYELEATLHDANGTLLASDTREIAIGKRNGTIIHEITNANAISKGGMDLLFAWAKDENLTVLADLLPGMFGPHYQASTMPMSVGAETAEYVPGRIMTLLYNNRASSTSTALEISTYLHLENATEDPAIASYYAFDIGEPKLGEHNARIIRLADDAPIRICRVDTVSQDAKDGVFLTTEEQIIASDINEEDGWTTSASKPFALMGVMKPYQLAEDELTPNSEIYGYYHHLNGADTLVFTFSPTDGGSPITSTNTAGLSRIDHIEQNLDPSFYEFYCVFAPNKIPEGKYEVRIEALDRHGALIPQLTATFNLTLTP